MADVLGLPVPTAGPVFTAALAVHVLAGMTCVASGAGAALFRKGGRAHARAGRTYVIGLCIMLLTFGVMVAVRWDHNAHLLPIGLIAAGAGLTGYWNRRHGGPDRIHIAAMGTSYVALLTGFYVDNGPHLPVWRLLPDWSFWVLPSAVGGPVIIAAMRRRRPRVATANSHPEVTRHDPGPRPQSGTRPRPGRQQGRDAR